MAKQNPQQLVDDVRRYLSQDPTIGDASKIVVAAEKRGGLFNRRTVLTLEGKAQNDAEANAIGEMVAAKVGDAAEVENRVVAAG